MDNSQQEGEEKQLHRIVQRREPKGGNSDFCVEEGSGDHRYGIAEIASEHHTPEHSGNTAVHEHGEGFSQALLNIPEFEQNHAAD